MKIYLKKIAFLSLALMLMFFSASCKNDGTKKSMEDEAKKLAYKLYKEVIENPEKQNFYIDEDTINNAKNAEFSYSIVDLGEDIKTLLLMIDLEDGSGVRYIKMYKYDKESKKLKDSKYSIPEGVASAGGFRGALAKSKDGKDLIQTTISSGTGDITMYKVDIDKGNYDEDTVFEGSMRDGNLNPNINGESVDFVKVSDKEHLKEVLKEKKKESDKRSAKEIEKLIKDEEAKGNTVVSGELKIMTRQEVLNVQNMQDPNPNSDYDEKFVILLLNEKKALTGRSMGLNEESTRPVQMIRLRGVGIDYPKYADKKVWVSIEPGWFWPSDTSLPLGEPKISEFKIL